MPKIERYSQGAPSWVDYGAADQEAAKSFYADLFGWSYEEHPMDLGDGKTHWYSVGLKGDLSTAAIYSQVSVEAEMGVPPHWMTYITVEDVDATTAKVKELDGTVIAEPFDVIDTGRMSLIQEPTGGVFHLCQPKARIGAEVQGEHGALVWAEILTTDQQVTAEFYSKLLDLDVNSDMPSLDGSPYIVFMAGDEPLAGCMTMPEHLQQQNIPSHWDVYFQVEDVDATLKLAASKGGNPMIEGMDIPGVGRIGYLMDPQGAGFGILTPEPM